MIRKPALLGGKPASPSPLPFVRPVLPKLDELAEPYQEILRTGMVTTGSYAERLGEVVAEALGVEYAIAVSSCTTGLLLATQALNLPKGSEVILPSFTFMASALGPVWNGLKLNFVDVDWKTMNLDPQRVESLVNRNTSAIIAVHQFGNPAAIGELKKIADRHEVKLIFDAAHGFGSLYQGQPVGGFGQAEVLSMTPTKLVVAAEGGIVATNDAALAEHVRLGRNYGNPGNYDCLFPGLNARMSELHAILGLASFRQLGKAAGWRNYMVLRYKEMLSDLPGLRFQEVHPGNQCSYKDLSIIVDEHEFGLSRGLLAEALRAEQIQTRVYYSPVLHKMTAFQRFHLEDDRFDLKNTLYLEKSALSLPLFSDMTDDEAEIVCRAIRSIHYFRKEILSRHAA